MNTCRRLIINPCEINGVCVTTVIVLGTDTVYNREPQDKPNKNRQLLLKEKPFEYGKGVFECPP